MQDMKGYFSWVTVYEKESSRNPGNEKTESFGGR